MEKLVCTPLLPAMNIPDKPSSRAASREKLGDALLGRFLRLAAGGWVPARWFEPGVPPPEARAARVGRLKIEIVSHCWNYSHFMVYQLSSLVNHPPRDVEVILTVYHSPEDGRTVELLDFFGKRAVPGVTWNWRPLPKESLFRRAIGRNEAALGTKADWIWFTDCDLMFREGCLDELAALVQGRKDALVFPRIERCTALLPGEDPLLQAGRGKPRVVDIEGEQFTERECTRATGPLQITHGDVARACGYCQVLKYYQKPSPVWCKAYEDRAFRWLLRTQGTPLDIPGVYRIRHVEKGRYTGGSLNTGVRSRIRRLTSR